MNILNNKLILIVIIQQARCLIRDLSICHDDFELNPKDGVLPKHTFNWLGFVQYIHVTTGLPHQSKAPRVVLIHRQFVVGTAVDMIRLPKNYKLGNIVLVDYERDEADCGLTMNQIKMGVRCPRAYLEMPYSDVTPHPEFTRFGVENSLALVKLLRPTKSVYVVPICMPTLSERMVKRSNKAVYMVDYISSVPTDLEVERMGKRTLKLYTHKECRKHRTKTNLGSEGVSHLFCTSGCGVRPGVPIITHAVNGAFELLGIAFGGGRCTSSSMRRRFNAEPPLYVDVYPYVTWMINVITAQLVPKAFPQNFKLVDGRKYVAGWGWMMKAVDHECWYKLGKTYVQQWTSTGMVANQGVYFRARKLQKTGWVGRTHMTGNQCFRGTRRNHQTGSFFYQERFHVTARPQGQLTINLKVSAGIECTIVCALLGMPNHLTSPFVTGVGGYNITLQFTTDWFPYTFYFSMKLFGQKTTDTDFAKWIKERNEGFW